MWNTEIFLRAHASLRAAPGDLDAILAAIQPILEDLKSLLATPPKSESHRALLASKKLSVDGEEYKVNDVFINDAARVSDELSLDEIAAAHLVFYTAGDSKRLQVPATESAITLFYVRQLAIIDILRFLVESLPKTRLSIAFPVKVTPFTHVLAALEQVEQKLAQINEKRRATEFIGFTDSLQQISLEFLQKQRAALAELLAVVASMPEGGDFARFVERLSLIRDIDVRSYFPAVVAFAAAYRGAPSENYKSVVSPEAFDKVWKFPPFQHAVALAFYTFTDSAEESAVHAAIDGGAFEMWLALASENGPKDGIEGSVMTDLVLVSATSIAVTAEQSSMNSDNVEAVGLLARVFITNHPHVLREMRLSEEDLQLAYTLPSTKARAPPGVDLERFFLLVAASHRKRPSAQLFFEDGEALHGFLVWASDCQVAFMAAAYAELLAALANDAETSLGINALLNDDSTEAAATTATVSDTLDPPSGSNSAAVVGARPLSWTYILQLLDEHARGVSAAAPEPISDLQLVANSYLRLLARVTAYSPSVATMLRQRALPVLLKLLKLQLPVSGVLAALASFAGADLWPPINSLLLGRLDMVLTSQSDTLAFITLLKSLAPYEGGKTQQYLGFVLGTVLPYSSKNSGTENLQIACLRYLETLLGSPTDHVNAADNMVTTTAVVTTSIGQSIVDVSNAAIRFAFEPRVYRALFAPFETPFDVLNGLQATHPRVRAAVLAAQICARLLQLSSAFGRPVLYNLHIVPQLALYAGSVHNPDLSLACLRILALLSNNAEFRPAVGRQSRLLSILQSSSESSRVRVALINLLGGFNTPLANKSLLLRILLAELYSSSLPKQYMSLAHFLLGFRQDELQLQLKLVLDDGVGGVQTGASLFAVVCEMLVNELASGGELLRPCTEIVGYLVKDPLTSRLVLNYLRPDGYLRRILRLEQAPPTPAPVAADFYEHRAIMLEIWKIEIQACQSLLLLTTENHYITELVPCVFQLFDFDNVSPDSVVALRCLRAWCDLVPALIATGAPQAGVTFVSRALEILVAKLPIYAHANADFARPVAKLLKLLFSQYLANGADYSIIRTSAVIFRAAISSVQPATMNEELRSELYALCIQYLITALASGNLEILHISQHELDVVGDTVLQTLFGDVFNTLNRRLGANALVLVQLAVKLGQRLKSRAIVDKFIKCNFVGCLIDQKVVPTLLRCRDGTIGSDIGAVAATNGGVSSGGGIVVGAGGPGPSNINSADATSNSTSSATTISAAAASSLKTSETTSLGGGNAVSGGNGSVALGAKGGIVAAGSNGGAVTTGGEEAPDAGDDDGVKEKDDEGVKPPTERQLNESLVVALSLLMSVSQTRSGALEVARSSFVTTADRALDRLPENVLLLVFETLATVLISLGPDYPGFMVPLRNLVRSNRNLIEDIFAGESNTKVTKCLTLIVTEVLERAV